MLKAILDCVSICYVKCTDGITIVTHSVPLELCYSVLILMGCKWNSHCGRFLATCDKPCRQMLWQGYMWNSHNCKGCYFKLIAEMLNWASSQMWGRLYLPMFLFRGGLFTLMLIDPLMVLPMFQSSLPTILKLSMVVEWPVVLQWSYMSWLSIQCRKDHFCRTSMPKAHPQLGKWVKCQS